MERGTFTLWKNNCVIVPLVPFLLLRLCIVLYMSAMENNYFSLLLLQLSRDGQGKSFLMI